jgi:DNA-binding beta-propeller fold protein YncE
MAEPYGITLHQNHLYVANYGSDEICVFPIAASGDVAPVRRISGPLTGLSGPSGITVLDGELYVTNWDSNTVTVYPATAAGDITPSRIIEGVSTGLETPWGIDAPQIDDLVFADSFESGGTTEWTQAVGAL